jgi:hypothetical protein
MIGLVAAIAIAIACGGRVTGNCQLCGQTCVDTTSDVLNCGGCGSTCSVGQSCVGGKCAGGASGSTSCSDPSLYDCGDGSCTDFVTDPKNCGGCGIDCGGGACMKGVCVATDCKTNGAECAMDAECCNDFCKSDGVCGCVPKGSPGCTVDLDCCDLTGSCDGSGVCQ